MGEKSQVGPLSDRGQGHGQRAQVQTNPMNPSSAWREPVSQKEFSKEPKVTLKEKTARDEENVVKEAPKKSLKFDPIVSQRIRGVRRVVRFRDTMRCRDRICRD